MSAAAYRIFFLALLGALLLTAARGAEHPPANAPLALAATSDDFSAPSLNTSLWTIVDPVGDGSVAMNGTQLTLTVPAGTDHDVWRNGNRALRVMQPVANTDFELEVKFESAVTARYQIQGLLIEQSAGNFLRFDVHSDGTSRRLFAASFVNGTPTARYNQPLAGQAPTWLRVRRTGNQWTLSHSANGLSWTAAFAFSHAMTVTAGGVFAGNAGPNPAHTVLVDYFFDTAAPIDPEDAPPNTDTTAPIISDVNVSPNVNAATITFTTDEPATGRIAYGTTTAYGATAEGASGQTAHYITLSGLSSGTTYHYQLSAEDASGNLRTLADASFQTPSASGPVIVVWHGAHQKVGHLGLPQPDFNLMGNVSDPEGVGSLTYRINGGGAQSLSIGNRPDGFGDGRRLAATGDFNADIPISALTPGSNTIQLTATDQLGAVSTTSVTVERRTGSSPLPYTINWSTVTDPQDVGQYVDGHWGLSEGGLRTLRTGYDRLFMIGDATWQDYEVTVPVTVHGVDPETGPYSGANGLGLIPRFAGHHVGGYRNWPVAQPKWGYKPFGGLGWVRWYSGSTKSPTRDFQDGDFDTSRHFGTVGLTLGRTYWMKMRAETQPDAPSGEGVTTYRWKMWRDDQSEPAGWDWSYTQTSAYALRKGALLLVAHHVDATFGNVHVVPIGQDDATAPVIANVQAASEATRAIITWTTDEPATSRVDYGPTTAYESGFVENATLTTTHQMTLESLQPETTYHFRIVAQDGSGNDAVSADYTFTTADLSVTPIASDDFNGSSVDLSVWEFVDPLGDATLSTTGTQLSIALPAGTKHDAWHPTSTAARLLQPAPNTDFEVIAKFDAPLAAHIQNYGLLIEEAPQRFLRFDVYSTSSSVNAFAALVTSTGATRKESKTIPPSFPLWLRVQRTGDSWTYAYSGNGSAWTPVATFTQALSVTKVGVFVGNNGSTPPAFTALVDYFHNTAPDASSLTATTVPQIGLPERLIQPYTFSPPYPNPFTNAAQFELTVAEAQPITIEVFNLLGQRVETVYNDILPAHTPLMMQLDGHRLASGLYLLRVQGQTFTEHHKIIIVK